MNLQTFISKCQIGKVDHYLQMQIYHLLRCVYTDRNQHRKNSLHVCVDVFILQGLAIISV